MRYLALFIGLWVVADVGFSFTTTCELSKQSMTKGRLTLLCERDTCRVHLSETIVTGYGDLFPGWHFQFKLSNHTRPENAYYKGDVTLRFAETDRENVYEASLRLKANGTLDGITRAEIQVVSDSFPETLTTVWASALTCQDQLTGDAKD